MKEWNAAFIGDEDYNALMDSEVFRNYARIVEAGEKAEKKAKKKKEKEKKKEIKKEKNFPGFFRKNLDYGCYGEEEIDTMVKEAMAVLAGDENEGEGEDKDEDAPEESEESEGAEEAEDVEESEEVAESDLEETVETNDDSPASSTSSSGEYDYKYKELYNTGAGDSKYIDIGLTKDTEKLIESGLSKEETNKTESNESPPTPVEAKEIADEIEEAVEDKEADKDEDKTEELPEEVKEAINTINGIFKKEGGGDIIATVHDAISAAEKMLGLDTNLAYILSKMGK